MARYSIFVTLTTVKWILSGVLQTIRFYAENSFWHFKQFSYFSNLLPRGIMTVIS